MLAAHAALSFDPGRIRDRRGRRAVSAGKLLGAKRVKTAEGAIAKGLVTLDRLKAKAALASTASSSAFDAASSLATASARKGCAAQANNPSQKAEFKGDGYEAKVDVGKGAAEIGIDLGAGGVRAEIDFGICDKNDDAFKAPDCPDAEGTLEASDESEYYVNMRIFKAAELLLSQNLEFSAKTTIEPIQVDQDAKLEYFEIDHTYKNSDRARRLEPGVRQDQPQVRLPREHPGQLPRRHLRPHPHRRRSQIRRRRRRGGRAPRSPRHRVRPEPGGQGGG